MLNLTPQVMAVAWVVVCVAAAVVEGLSTQLLSVWFAIGAAAASVAAILGASFTVQSAVFLGVSVLMLACVRPIAKKSFDTKKESTNADRVIGEVGIVLEAIDNELSVGRVRVMGLEWAARARDGGSIPKDSRVRIHAIEGVKLIVTPEPAKISDSAAAQP